MTIWFPSSCKFAGNQLECDLSKNHLPHDASDQSIEFFVVCSSRRDEIRCQGRRDSATVELFRYRLHSGIAPGLRLSSLFSRKSLSAGVWGVSGTELRARF